MLRTRVIPCLQLIDDVLVKTVKFEDYNYIGDPINTVRIFNELEVDELCFLDIRASYEKREPNFSVLNKIANECFMPLAYGGGVNSFETAVHILSIGFEKIIINTAAYKNPEIVTKIAEHVGNQSVIGSIDVRKNFFGNYKVYINDGKKKVSIDPIEYAQILEAKGVGELLITSINKDGTWDGYDINITRKISENVSVPVIANGGAGKVQHIGEVVKEGKADAAALGSMVVYQAKGMGVLVNFPDKKELEKELSAN